MKKEETMEIVVGEGVLYQMKAFYNFKPKKPITRKLLIKLSKESIKDNKI